MTVSTRFLISLLLSVLIFSSVGNTVFAHQMTVNNLPSDLTSWKTYGSPLVSSSGALLHGSGKEWVSVDIDADEINQSYMVFAAYVHKDDKRAHMKASDKVRSGNPYLYAYALDRQGKIKKYMTGADIMSISRSRGVHVVYGIFPRNSGIETIRVFLKQSSVKNLSNEGVNVTFMSPIFLEAQSRQQAQDLVQDFANLNLSYR